MRKVNTQPNETPEPTQRDDQDWQKQVCQMTTQTVRWLIFAVVVVLVALILAITGAPKEAWGIFSGFGLLFSGYEVYRQQK
jgi:type IV secretory pathway TrbF-like protein